MQRREVLSILGLGTGVGVVALLIGCDAGAGPVETGHEPDAATPPSDAPAKPPDACNAQTVLMHDTYAQALYLDGSLGPLTGIIYVAYVMAGSATTLDFWHGHGGVLHRFTVEPAHFADLKQGKRVTLGTTIVDGHAHTLFIDPIDESYRVPGAADTPVSLGC